MQEWLQWWWHNLWKLRFIASVQRRSKQTREKSKLVTPWSLHLIQNSNLFLLGIIAIISPAFHVAILHLHKCWCQSQWLTTEWWLIIKVEKLAPITKCTKISTLYMAHNSVKWEKVLEILIQKKKKYFSTRSMDEFSHLAELPEVGFFQQSSTINLKIAIFKHLSSLHCNWDQCSLPFHWSVQGQSSPNYFKSQFMSSELPLLLPFLRLNVIFQLTDLVFMGNPLEEELSEAEEYNNKVVRYVSKSF